MLTTGRKLSRCLQPLRLSKVLTKFSSNSNNLLYEVRIYQCLPSAFKEFLQLTASKAFSERLLASAPYGSWRTEIGALNQIFHIWPYSSVSERSKVRESLTKNDKWMALVPKLAATWDWQTSHMCESTGKVCDESQFAGGMYYYIFSKNAGNKFVEGFSVPEEFQKDAAVLGQFKVVLGDPVGAIYTVLNCRDLDTGYEVLTRNTKVLEDSKSKTSLMYPVSISPMQ